MTDKKITSLFFSERNFMAIVEAVQGWTLKTYQHRIDKLYNETILEIMKSNYSRRVATTDVHDVEDYVLTLNKQVLRQTLETISRDVNAFAKPDRLNVEEQFGLAKNSVSWPTPRAGFRLGDDHIIPKPDKTSLPSEDPGGENNTMELYEKESRRRHAEMEAAPKTNVPMMIGSDTLLPTIFESKEEDDEEEEKPEQEPEFMNVFQEGTGLPASSLRNHTSSSVSDQAISHIQAIRQTQSNANNDQPTSRQIPTRPVPTPERRPEKPLAELNSDDSILRLQTDLQNLTKKMDSLLECLQLDRKSHDVIAEPLPERMIRLTSVFSSADRDLGKYSSINRFEVDLKDGARITKLLMPRCLNTIPYIRVDFSKESRVIDLQSFGQDFLKAEIAYQGAGSILISIADLNGREMYSRNFDVMKLSAIQVRDDHILVEAGLHHLREGDTVRFLDVECHNSSLKCELSRPKGFAVSIVDHVHFIITELSSLKGDDEVYIGSAMKLKQQVFVEYETY